MAQTSTHKTLDLSMTGNTTRSGYGRFPSISVNNKGIVVEMHQKAGVFSLSYLYYSVGVLDDKRSVINWGEDIYMEDYGDYPKIAINDNNEVVEVHESQGLRRGVWYRYGTVNVYKKQINWEKRSTLVVNGGKNPAVALGNDRKVVIVYESAYTFVESETFYWVGNLIPNGDPKIAFVGSKAPLFNTTRNGVTELSVAINARGFLVAAGRGSNHELVYVVGKFNGSESSENTVTWQNETQYDMGSNYPSVGLDDKLRVISVQQSNLFRELSYRVGMITYSDSGSATKGNYCLKWHTEKKPYDHGALPVIAVSNGGTMIVEEHETSFAGFGINGNKLFNRIGTFKEY